MTTRIVGISLSLGGKHTHPQLGLRSGTPEGAAWRGLRGDPRLRRLGFRHSRRVSVARLLAFSQVLSGQSLSADAMDPQRQSSTDGNNIPTSAFALKRPSMDIRAKVLSVVVLSALAPALLVGVASYLTSREILIEKVNNQLAGRAASSGEQVNQWFRERALDTQIFANSFIVSDNLRRWNTAKKTPDKRAAAESQKKLQEYLDQVQNRYPLYRELFLVDPHGTLVAKTRPFMEEVEKEIAPELLMSNGDTSLQRMGGELVFHVRQEVRDTHDEPVGTLVTVSNLSELWGRLGAELPSNMASCASSIRPGNHSSTAASDRPILPAT